ncbi:hypothetical protein SprV_0702307200 [Sparganum proliferum]
MLALFKVIPEATNRIGGLAHYKVDIAEFSDVWFSEQSELVVVGVGYTFWAGHHRPERRESGVVFVIRNDIMRRLSCLPQSIDDRRMSLRLPLQGSNYATIINAHATK